MVFLTQMVPQFSLRVSSDGGVAWTTDERYPGGSRSSRTSYLLSRQHLMERKVLHTIGK